MVEPGSPRAVGAQQRDTSRAARSPRASFPITKTQGRRDKHRAADNKLHQHGRQRDNHHAAQLPASVNSHKEPPRPLIRPRRYRTGRDCFTAAAA